MAFLNLDNHFLKSIFVILLAIVLMTSIPLYYFLQLGVTEKKQTIFDHAVLLSNVISQAELANHSTREKYASIHERLEANEAVLQDLRTNFELLSLRDNSLEYLVATYEGDQIHFIAYNKNQPPHVDIKDKHLAVPMRKALAGQNGTINELDYQGKVVFAAYATVPDTPWGLVIKEDYEDLTASYYQAIYFIVTLGVLLFVFISITHYRSNRQKNRQIKQSEDRFQQLVESSHDWVWEVNTEGVYTYVSPQVEQILGYKVSEVLGKRPFDLMPKKEGAHLLKEFNKAILDPVDITNMENVNLHKDGRRVHLLSSASPFFNDENEFCGFRGLDRDISTLKAHEAEIMQIAYYDSLTGLANREQIINRMEEELSFCKRTNRYSIVLFMDLDGFKDINDSIGHDVGDEVLIETALRIKGTLRTYDTVGRLGGDEFVALMRSTTADLNALVTEVDHLLKRLLKAINQPICVRKHQLQVGVSIGVAIMPRDGHDISEVLRHADAAMYQAKNSGKNQYQFYHDRLQKEADNKLQLKNELNQAFSENQFELYYQRQTDIAGQVTTGFEALIRWNHPTKGFMAPDKFLPAIEEFNLTSELDEWVINRACYDIDTHLKDYIEHFSVSLNLTPNAFDKADLLEFFLDKMALYSVKANQLTIEVTEGSLVKDLERAHSVMEALSTAGLKIALDDFGSGYSSLSYLSKLKFDTIKMDGSFMKGLTDNQTNQNICRLIIRLANDLEKNVVAEGVEHQAQIDFLAKQGVKCIQGYIYAKPQNLTSTIKLLDNEFSSVG